jgi:hypothetical protein
MMRALAAVVALVFVPALAGCWLPRSLDVPVAARWGFGAVLLLLVVTVLHGIGVGPPVAFVAAAVVVAAGAARVSSAIGAIRRASATDRAIAALVLVPVVAAALFTLSTPVDAGDAVMAWYAKARALLDWPPVAQVPYAEYSNLGTMGWSLLLRVSGWAYEPAARLVFPALYAAFALSLSDSLERPLSRHAIWAVPLAMLATFDLRLIANGYQDVPVASVAGLASVLLANHLRTGDRGHGLLALFFAGTLGLIKIEGVVLAAVLVVSWLAIQRFEPLRRRSWIPGLLMVCALAALWPALVWIHGVRVDQGQYSAFEGASMTDLFGRSARLPTIARAFIATGPRFLVPLAAGLVLGVAAWRRSPAARRVLTFFGLAVVLHSLWIVAVFLLTNLDVNWHLATAFDRLVLQQAICVWTPAMVVSAVGLADVAWPQITESKDSQGVPKTRSTHGEERFGGRPAGQAAGHGRIESQE